jgi:hypothetical protein
MVAGIADVVSNGCRTHGSEAGSCRERRQSMWIPRALPCPAAHGRGMAALDGFGNHRMWRAIRYVVAEQGDAMAVFENCEI